MANKFCQKLHYSPRFLSVSLIWRYVTLYDRSPNQTKYEIIYYLNKKLKPYKLWDRQSRLRVYIFSLQRYKVLSLFNDGVVLRIQLITVHFKWISFSILLIVLRYAINHEKVDGDPFIYLARPLILSRSIIQLAAYY